MTYLLIGGNLLMALGFVLRFNHLPPQIPLLYSKIWGEDQLVDLWYIIVLPILLNLFFFLNNYIYKKLFNGNNLIQKIVYYLNLFLILSITFIFLKIILLV